MKRSYSIIAFLFAVLTAFAQGKNTLPADGTLIDKQPEGTLYENMYRTANVYAAYGSMSTNRTYDGYVGNVVVSADGKKIYMKDPYIKLAPGTWIEGELNNGVAEFKFPQIIYNKQGVKGYAWKLVISGQEIGIDEKTQSVKFKWDGKTLSQQNSDEIIGMLNENNEWMGYAASQTVMYVMDEKGAKPADESKAYTYRMSYYDTSGSQKTASTRVVIDGTDIYLGDIFDPGFWLKGTISGNKATFPAQYMGVHANSSHAYMLPLDVNTTQAEEKLTFNYNAATGALSTEKAILVNIGKTNMSALEMYIAPSFTKMDYSVETPAKPKITDCQPYGYEGGDYGYISYALSTKSTSGKQLNQDKIVYNIYIDGELMTFDTDKYYYINNSLTDVPYSFADNYTDMFSGSKGRDFLIINGSQYIFIFKNFNKVGVKAIYVDGDKRLESEMSEYSFSPDTGIDAAVETAKVKNTTYTDISGRKLSAPAKGISIKTVEYENGETKTVKIMK